MDRFDKLDQKGRKMFEKHFIKYIKHIVGTDKFCHHDVDITGKTGSVSSIEIKTCIDDKFIEDYTGRTIINQMKVNHFREMLIQEPHRKLLFARYFTDGLILLDISKRIEINAGDLNIRSLAIGYNTVYDNNETKKDYDIAYLVYNSSYDKIYKYKRINDNIELILCNN